GNAWVRGRVEERYRSVGADASTHSGALRYGARECRGPRGSPSAHIARKVLPDGIPFQPSAELADRGRELDPASRMAAGPLLGAGPRGLELLDRRRPAGLRPGRPRRGAGNTGAGALRGAGPRTGTGART